MYKESSSRDLILEGVGRTVLTSHFLGEVDNHLKCASTADSQQEHLNVASCLGCGHACFRVYLLGVRQVFKWCELGSWWKCIVWLKLFYWVLAGEEDGSQCSWFVWRDGYLSCPSPPMLRDAVLLNVRVGKLKKTSSSPTLLIHFQQISKAEYA